MDSLHLRKAFRQKMQGDFLGVEMASEALISGRMETALTVNIILKTETWMIFLGISSEICSTVRADQPEEDGQASEADFPEIPDSGDIRISAAGRTLDGSDLRSEVSVSFKEAVFGCDRMLQLSDPNGKAQKLQVHIPAGIEDGKSIRLKGKGNPGYGGGASGDLFLKVHVEPETGWERKGQDIYTIAEIPFMTAVLGGEAKFSTLYGDVMCRIPAGTQCGGKIRLRGKGVPSMQNPSVKGDQYVTIQIQVPKAVSREAAQKLKEYGMAMDRSCSGRRGSAV